MSKTHNRESDVVKSSKFLKDEISEGSLQILQASAPLTIFNQNTIEMLATPQTIDIWDQTSENHTAYLMRQEALLEHAAHCSTQHNNEQIVKLV